MQRFHAVAGVVSVVAAAAAAPDLVRAQAEVPDGFEVIEIVRWPRYARLPTINNCGELAFSLQLEDNDPNQGSFEIFRYDNGSLVRLTDNEFRDRSPKINDRGEIVWTRMTTLPNEDQIILWQNGEESIVGAVGPGLMTVEPAINNLGWAAWGEGLERGCTGDIMLWDGHSTRRISELNERWDISPELNNIGDMAWSRMNVCENPWSAKIRLWSEGERRTLPTSFRQLQVPSINDRGQVAWTASDGVEIWSGGQTRLLTHSGGLPELNHIGDVLFNRWHDELQNWQIWLFRASDGRFMRLVDDPDANHTWPDINDWQEAVWYWSRGPQDRKWGIMMMRRVRTGDSDFDGAIDAADYAAFSECMTGPRRVDRLCDCRFLDIDYDGDVDLGDFARFQNAYQGP